MMDFRRILVENRRAVWILAAALVVNAALYVLVVYPLEQRVNAEEQQASDATRDLNAARRAFEAAKATVSGKKQADDELEKFYREVLAADVSAARRTLFPRVEQMARKANLTTEGGRFESPEHQRGLRRLAMRMSLTGEYSDIRAFIHQLETAPEFIVLESVAVTQGNEGERILDVLAQVATYYRPGTDGD